MEQIAVAAATVQVFAAACDVLQVDHVFCWGLVVGVALKNALIKVGPICVCLALSVDLACAADGVQVAIQNAQRVQIAVVFGGF